MNATLCPTCFEVPATMLPDARVALLMRISQQALANPRVREIARQLRSMITDKLGRSPTQGEMVQWLADAGHLLTEYKPDPPGEEVFQAVEYTLGGGASSEVSPITGRAKGVGDCEDLAGMFVALALALGIPARVRWWSQPGAPLNHVAAEAKIGNDWVNVETTIPGAHVGETPYQALDRVGPDYRSRIFGLREAAGGVFAPSGQVFAPAGISVRANRGRALGGSGSGAETPPPSGSADIRIASMPDDWFTYGFIEVDGHEVPERRLDGDRSTWVTSVSPGWHDLLLHFRDGSLRTWRARVPAEGLTLDLYTIIAGQPHYPVRIFNMPHGGNVFIDGQHVDGTWASDGMIEWDVPATLERHVVRVVAPDGSAKESTVDVTSAGASLNYMTMSAAAGGGDGGVGLVGDTATLGLVHMPPYGGVWVDGAQVNGGAWDATNTTWQIQVSPGRHTIRVAAPGNAWTRTVRVEVPAAGTTVDVGQQRELEKQDPPPSAASLATLALVHMPPYGGVWVDGVQVNGGAWDATNTAWQIQVAPGKHEVRVVAPANAWTRSVTVDVPTSGASVDVGRVDTAGTDKQPAPPAADASTVELTLHADNCDGFRLLTLRGANGVVSTIHETIVGSRMPQGSDLGPMGADPTRTCMENWRTHVPPGTYTVRGVLRNGRDGTAQIIVPTSAASQVVSMTDLSWTWARSGQIIVHGVPQVPAPDLTSLTRSDRTVYTVTLTPLGGDADSVISLPPDGTDFVGYAAPGPYTLRVNESVGSSSTVYYSQRINVSTDLTTEVTAVAPHSDTAPPPSSGMSSVRLVGLPVGWTFAMGSAVSTAMPVPSTFPTDSTGPAEGARILPVATTRTVAGTTLSYAEVPIVTLPMGAGIATITSSRGVTVHMPVVIDSPTESLDVSYDVERALRYASALRGITGVQPVNGARVGYLADDADVLTRQLGLRGTQGAPLGEVVEFQTLGTQPDSLGRLPTVIFVKGRGLQLAWVTAKELQRLRNQIQFLRTHLQPDATYPYEIGQ